MSNDFDNSQGFPLGAAFGTVEELIAAMTPEIYAKLRTAIELGKWQDGSRLSPEQLEQCMEVMILYEARYLPEEQRTGANLPQSCQSKREEASKLRILNDIELTDPSQGEDA